MPNSPAPLSEQLYFAYGSNLHLTQMAKRCPQCRYIGFAKLHQYRFQVNERGFANVVPSSNHQVEGLVYLLSPTDQAKLDRYEGYPDKYQRVLLPIEIFTAGINLVGRSVPEVARLLQNRNHSLPIATSQFKKVLVYVSTNYTRNGTPQPEYINRMNAGIVDACKLGMSTPYIKSCLRRYIVAQAPPASVRDSLQKRTTVEKSRSNRPYPPTANTHLMNTNTRCEHTTPVHQTLTSTARGSSKGAPLKTRAQPPSTKGTSDLVYRSRPRPIQNGHA